MYVCSLYPGPCMLLGDCWSLSARARAEVPLQWTRASWRATIPRASAVDGGADRFVDASQRNGQPRPRRARRNINEHLHSTLRSTFKRSVLKGIRCIALRKLGGYIDYKRMVGLYRQ